MTWKNDNKFKQYKQRNLPVGMTVSFDMSWNKRSSSNVCNSLSGYALMIGYKSKKIIAGIISSKICRICSSAGKNDEDLPTHVYSKNYDGSSKAMDVYVALHLCKSLFINTNKC